MEQWPGIMRLRRNECGRDLIVGDLHGMRELLETELERIEFDKSRDRLICVGDLIDRGPDSLGTLRLLSEPWFVSVMGNHDFAAALNCMAMRAPVSAEGYMEMRILPEPWLLGLGNVEEREIVDRVSRLPLVIEISAGRDIAGVVHAEVPPAFSSWESFIEWVERQSSEQEKRDWSAQLLWGRSYASLEGAPDPAHSHGTALLPGVTSLFHGHTIAMENGFRPWCVGNRHHIDTGAYLLHTTGQSPASSTRSEGPQLTIMDIWNPGHPL